MSVAVPAPVVLVVVVNFLVFFFMKTTRLLLLQSLWPLRLQLILLQLPSLDCA